MIFARIREHGVWIRCGEGVDEAGLRALFGYARLVRFPKLRRPRGFFVEEPGEIVESEEPVEPDSGGERP